MTDAAPPPPPPPPYGASPPAYPATQPLQGAFGPVGKVRSTGVCILLAFVTLGIYALVWYYVVHEEMKRHSGQGLGGVVALLIAFFIGIVSPYLASNEVGDLYARTGRAKPVSAVTGLWYFPGMLILVGPFIWFIKTNGALNDYWKSMGAPAS